MTKYIVVKGDCSENLETIVRNHLRQGWQLQGGVSTTTIDGEIWYLQALSA